jgi:hypothetical protein
MSFGNWADSKVKNLGWVDVALVKLSCTAFGIMLAALIPSLIEINIWWIVVAIVILVIKPTYTAFKK